MITSTQPSPALPRVVSPQEWEAAAAELRAAEKEHTRAGDALAARRRRMPMVEFGSYTFQGADGPCTLLDLFEGRRQLVVYQFMRGPSWCEGCCMVADHIGELAHLHARDTSLAVASLSDYRDLAALRERMCATATGCSAPTSPPAVAWRRWAASGASSTSPRSGARRPGRTPHQVARRLRRTSGGACTMSTAHDEH
jgi:predicted dithiol-disulfide oxidoreductase (DUF899 family)